MGLSFADCIPLTDTIELLEEHGLQRLCPEVEQNRPCFSLGPLVYVNEI